MRLTLSLTLLFLILSCSDGSLVSVPKNKFSEDISKLEKEIQSICHIRSRVVSSWQTNSLEYIKVIFIENQADRKCNDDEIRNLVESFLRDQQYQLKDGIYLEMYEVDKFVLKKLN